LKIIEVTNVDFSLRHFLLPLMRELKARGHEVIGVCADGALVAEVRGEGVRVVTLPLARSLSPVAQWRALWALYWFFKAEKPDLVHAHMPISGFLARMAAGAARVPKIAYTCHGFLFNQPGSLLRRGLSFVLEFVAARVTDVFLTVSQEEARDARRLHIFRDALPVLNGRDPAIFHPDAAARAEIRASLGVAQDRVVFVTVSRLVRHKGYPELLAAMRGIAGELWVVGERLASDHGEDMAPYFEAAAHNGVVVRSLGYRRDVARILAAADVFVLASHFEGLPMSVIEAMLCGLPVVATAIRGPREQVREGETGYLVPPGDSQRLHDALKRLENDAPRRVSFGEAGLLVATEKFVEENVITRSVEALGA